MVTAPAPHVAPLIWAVEPTTTGGDSTLKLVAVPGLTVTGAAAIRPSELTAVRICGPEVRNVTGKVIAPLSDGMNVCWSGGPSPVATAAASESASVTVPV